MDSKLAPPLAPPDVFDAGSVVWRRWRVVPDAHGAPLLTGLLGFPWRQPVLEARCVAPDPSNQSGSYTGRYHRAVPAVDCTCGIYAVRDNSEPPTLPRPRRGEPTVEGFVQLSGRIVKDLRGLRAERAEIIGPLMVRIGDRTALDRALARSASRLVSRGNVYRVVRRRHANVPLQDLLSPLAKGLTRRYGCTVLVGRS